MADDDPFAEPEDGERTVIVPNPGGRRAGVAAPAAIPAAAPAAAPVAAPVAARAGAGEPASPAPAPAAPSADPGGDARLAAGMTGMNPLNAAAATLFALVSRIRNRAQHPDSAALRRSVVAEVRGFEARALKAGVDPQAVKVARYAICATLDDVVLNTPWGGTSIWAQQSMVGTFHRETVGGDRFYDLLARLEQDPGRNVDLLEFLYMCLSLGFEGRLRVAQGGADRHVEIRAGLARIIRNQRGAVEAGLSPHWAGVDRPHRNLSRWKPFWIAVAACVALLTVAFTGLSYALSGSTERLRGQLSVLDPGTPAALERRAPPVVIPAPPSNVELDRVSGFLEEEIAEGIVNVFQDNNTITVRIAGSGMFGPGSDSLNPDFVVPLNRVAAALDGTEGPVIVAGHSDSSPINNARFKSNAALSLARAETVRKRLAEQLADGDRLSAEGRSDAEPIADNATVEGRALNRRIEIVLVRRDAT